MCFGFVERSRGPRRLPQRRFTKSYALAPPLPRLALSRCSNASRNTADFETRLSRAILSRRASSSSEILQVTVVTPERVIQIPVTSNTKPEPPGSPAGRVRRPQAHLAGEFLRRFFVQRRPLPTAVWDHRDRHAVAQEVFGGGEQRFAVALEVLGGDHGSRRRHLGAGRSKQDEEQQRGRGSNETARSHVRPPFLHRRQARLRTHAARWKIVSPGYMGKILGNARNSSLRPSTLIFPVSSDVTGLTSPR